MSVNLMSAIFETEFFDLKDEEGNTTKASTAKLVLLSMADHANDEGEGAYPSIERLCRKTALSEQTIRNTFDALRHNGIISLAGRSKYGTNNHTINTKSFPKAIGKEVTCLTLYPLDPQTGNVFPPNQSPPAMLPVIPESLLNTNKTSLDIQAIAEQANKKVDAMLDMANFSGAKREARVNAILSYLGERFHVNTETKKWREFAKYADGQQQNHGEDIKVFVAWLYSQKSFDLAFWPPSKMMEFWPSAFVKSEPVAEKFKDGSSYV